MKRILLLLTCLATPTAQSMQRPNLKTVGTPIPGVACAVTGAALLNLAWTLIKYARTPRRIDAMVQTDPVTFTSEIQEQLTAQTALLSELHDQQQATTATASLEQAITALTTQLQQPGHADDAVTTGLAALTQAVQRLTAQQAASADTAAGVEETTAPGNAELLTQLQQQRKQIETHAAATTAQTAEIQQLRTALNASRPRGCHPCAAGVAGFVTLPALLLALQYLLPLFITPFYPL